MVEGGGDLALEVSLAVKLPLLHGDVGNGGIYGGVTDTGTGTVANRFTIAAPNEETIAGGGVSGVDAVGISGV